jgi:ribose/xylose/arabinose/galactoside ABC-type transport system permease subunit
MTQVRPLRELAPHLVWEAVLLLAAGAVVAGLYNANSAVFTRGQVWAGIAILGFAACGLALSLRTATPNLAIGSVAVLAGWVFADRVNDGASVPVGFVLAVLAAAGVGVLLALLTGLTALPAWAVTLGGGFIVSAALLKATQGRLVPVTGASRTSAFGLWATAFVVVSIAGAVLFALPAVRRHLTANRPVAGGDDPGRWRPAKLVGALVGVTGSAVLAGVSGVLSVRLTSAAAFTENGQLPFALAAVLLGGVSVLGRRAGVFGVVLGVVIVDGVRRWQLLEGTDAATTLLTTGVLAVVGLLAVWLLELIGRRFSPLTAAAPALAPVSAFPGFPQQGALPVYDGSFPVSGSPMPGGPVSGPPVFVPPTSGVPGFVPTGTSSPSGIPSQATGYPPPPPPTSGGPAFGQPTYPAPPPGGPQYGAPPPAGGPGYPPGPQYGGPPQPPGAMIPQPWSVPGAGGSPQVPSQPVSPVSGPPNADPPPGYPQSPPPSWPPQH